MTHYFFLFQGVLNRLHLCNKKKAARITLLPYFFNIAFAVALEEVEEWVCVCRKAASRSSAEAIGIGSPDRCRKETTAFAAAPPQVLPKVPPPAAQRLY